jgi:hypothetical protein
VNNRGALDIAIRPIAQPTQKILCPGADAAVAGDLRGAEGGHECSGKRWLGRASRRVHVERRIAPVRVAFIGDRRGGPFGQRSAVYA